MHKVLSSVENHTLCKGNSLIRKDLTLQTICLIDNVYCLMEMYVRMVVLKWNKREYERKTTRKREIEQERMKGEETQ